MKYFQVISSKYQSFVSHPCSEMYGFSVVVVLLLEFSAIELFIMDSIATDSEAATEVLPSEKGGHTHPSVIQLYQKFKIDLSILISMKCLQDMSPKPNVK